VTPDRARTPHDKRGRIYASGHLMWKQHSAANKALDPAQPKRTRRKPPKAMSLSPPCGGACSRPRWTGLCFSGVGGSLLPSAAHWLALPPAVAVLDRAQLAAILSAPLLGPGIRRKPCLALPLRQLGLVPNPAGAQGARWRERAAAGVRRLLLGTRRRRGRC